MDAFLAFLEGFAEGSFFIIVHAFSSLEYIPFWLLG
jgi:hypothetical protein